MGLRGTRELLRNTKHRSSLGFTQAAQINIHGVDFAMSELVMADDFQRIQYEARWKI